MKVEQAKQVASNAIEELGLVQAVVERIWHDPKSEYDQYLRQVRGAMHFVQLLNLEDQFGEPKGILDSLTRLVEKMSGKKESLRDSVRKLQEGWKELKQAEKEMRGRLDKIPEQGEEGQEFSQEILDLAKDTWNIKDDPKKLSTDVLKRCDEIREGQDQKLRRYTWLSYVLYGIGWSLAVFGRLYGQDPLVEQG